MHSAHERHYAQRSCFSFHTSSGSNNVPFTAFNMTMTAWTLTYRIQNASECSLTWCDNNSNKHMKFQNVILKLSAQCVSLWRTGVEASRWSNESNSDRPRITCSDDNGLKWDVILDGWEHKKVSAGAATNTVFRTKYVTEIDRLDSFCWRLIHDWNTKKLQLWVAKT